MRSPVLQFAVFQDTEENRTIIELNKKDYAYSPGIGPGIQAQVYRYLATILLEYAHDAVNHTEMNLDALFYQDEMMLFEAGAFCNDPRDYAPYIELYP